MEDDEFEYISIRQAVEYVAKGIEPVSETIEKERVKQDVFSDEYAFAREKIKTMALKGYITLQGIELQKLRIEYLKDDIVSTIDRYENNNKFRYKVDKIKSGGNNFSVHALHYNDIKNLYEQMFPGYNEEKLKIFEESEDCENTIWIEDDVYRTMNGLYGIINKQRSNLFDNKVLRKFSSDLEKNIDYFTDQIQHFLEGRNLFTDIPMKDSKFNNIDWLKDFIYIQEFANFNMYIFVRVRFEELKNALNLNKQAADKKLTQKRAIKDALEKFKDSLPASKAAKEICEENDYGYSHDAVEDWLFKYDSTHFYRRKGKRGRPSKKSKIFDSQQQTKNNKNRWYK